MDGLITWAQNLPPLGLYGFIFAWLFVESTGFPISDEPLLLLAGYLAHRGRLDLALVIAVALVGKVAASCLAYWIGRHINLLRIARPKVRPAKGIGRVIYDFQPTEAFLLTAEDRARRQGVWGVFIGRLIPVVRSFISYPAGAAGMPFNLFLLATTAGSLIWIATWTLIGSALGASYEAAFRAWGSISWIILALFVVGLIALWLWSHRRSAHAAKQNEERQREPV